MLVIGGELPVGMRVGELEVVGAVMCAQDIDLVGDSCLAITALSADHPNEILERMGLRADLRIVGSTAPLCPMVNTNLRSEWETATGIFYLYCQRFVMPQYIII